MPLGRLVRLQSGRLAGPRYHANLMTPNLFKGHRRMTYREAAKVVLRQRGPMHYRELAETIVSQRMVGTVGATPEATLSSQINREIARRGALSEFIRLRPGVFGLRGLHERTDRVDTGTSSGLEAESVAPVEDSNVRVRVPFFPIYSQVRHLLRILPGFPGKQITGMLTTLHDLMGTPQDTVNWTNPAAWIPERLDGGDQDLANEIWERSNNEVNPRYVRGHWKLIRGYGLLSEDNEGVLQLTGRGRDFLQQQGGVTESEIDEAEGVSKLLSIVADNGPAPPRELLTEWADYLSRRSRFRAKSTTKDTMRRRLANLLERDLVERKGSLYSLTEKGLVYLDNTIDMESVGGSEQNKIRALVRKNERTVREHLRGLLHEMDPFGLEHLVKRLLEEMGYRKVEVTAQSGDRGIDVVGEIELGITSIREVVQVKRHRGAIQRTVLDALRGSLHHYRAVRGTIVTTSRFARGAQDAAVKEAAAPITLIDGDKLVDLLIEHGIGVEKRSVEILDLDADDLVVRETDD